MLGTALAVTQNNNKVLCYYLFILLVLIVSEMTYNVSMGTLNPTIPYHTILLVLFPTCG